MPDGDPVRMDRFAFESDAVVVVGRIKGHTAFRGPYESGLVKMIAVGLGKREGADLLHQKGFRVFGERLPQYARVIYDHCNILFGVGIIENEHDETCRIEVLPSEEIFDKEPALLTYAKSRMPRLLFPETDLLLVREIGKNFSGNGWIPMSRAPSELRMPPAGFKSREPWCWIFQRRATAALWGWARRTSPQSGPLRSWTPTQLIST